VTRLKGVVKFFRSDKGFGFVTLPDGRDLFLHTSEWNEQDDPCTGDHVTLIEGVGKKGPIARQVVRDQ
jgi:CspA family cold shock protein